MDRSSKEPAAHRAPDARPSCWVLSDGTVGMEIQSVGLAEALSLSPVVKRIAPRFPWSALPPRFWVAPLSALGPGSDVLAPPWPRLLIGTGRQTVAPMAAIREAARGATFTVHIQNPHIDLARFDLVVVPAHDRLSGANVVETLGALHRVTPARLAAEAARFAARYAHLPRPLVAALVGGSNRCYRMTPAVAARLADRLAAMAAAHGAGLAVTPSRRTGAANTRAIAARLAGLAADVWDGSGENPYFAMLALADAFVVTADSVNMVTEACATGKPVYVFEPDGGGRKFARFHAALRARGMTRPFTGSLEHWRYTPPDDMARVAAEVRRRLGWGAGGASGTEGD